VRTRKVSVGDRETELSAKEYAMLETFLRHPGQVLSRQQLLSHVWGYDFDPGSNVVDVYVGYLRRKLGKDRIETVRGMGYRLVVDCSLRSVHDAHRSGREVLADPQRVLPHDRDRAGGARSRRPVAPLRRRVA